VTCDHQVLFLLVFVFLCAVLSASSNAKQKLLSPVATKFLRAAHSQQSAQYPTHSGAPTLRSNATSSAFFLSMAILRGVQPFLQQHERVGGDSAPFK
jgi:hypothetical protein